MTITALVAIAATAASVSLTVTALLAWDLGCKWLAERAHVRIADNVLAETSSRLDEHERTIKALADGMRRRS